MKRYGWFVVIGLSALLVTAVGGEAAQTHLEGAYDNLYSGGTPSGAVAIIAGGNAGPYPNASDAPPKTAAGDVVLRQSAFGTMTGGVLAYPRSILKRDLNNSADTLMSSGTTYKDGVGIGAWDIQFPEVRSRGEGDLPDINDDGQVDGQNYFESDILTAAERYRSLLRINPYDTAAAEGLLKTYHERMIPLIFAGNNSHVWAFRGRIKKDNPLSEEITLLEEGVEFYKKAIHIFITLTEELPEADFLNKVAPLVDHDALRIPDSEPGMAVVPKLVESFIRAIAHQAETTALRVDRKYLSVFEYPVLPIESAAARSNIIQYINDEAALMEHELLLANAYLDVFSQSDGMVATDIGRASEVVEDLLEARTRITAGHISFAISRSADGGVTPDSYGVYAPEFVPFLYRGPDEVITFTNSYQNLYSRAVEIVNRAKVWEDEARHEDRNFDISQADLESRFNSIRSQYESEMTTMCGQIRSDSGALVPDVVLCLFPPEVRRNRYPYNLPGETAEGAIYSQWLQIENSESEVEGAMLDLASLIQRMEKKEEIAFKIAGGIENIAHLVLANGQKLAALEIQKGELLARQIEYEAMKKKEQGFWSSAMGIAGSALITIASGGTVLPLMAYAGVAAGSVLKLGQAYNDVAMAGDVANKGAKTQRAIGRINAQMQRIRAFESAQIHFQRRDELLYRTEEELHAMILQAERLKLNILMAEQRADMAQAELARLHGRVAFLLQEWARSTELIEQNPLNRPDYRLIRDLRMRDADEMFTYAQERCYLAAKAAEYRVNPSPSNVSHPVYQTIESILTARRSANLISVLDALHDQIESLYTGRGSTQADSMTVSFRNDIIQNNLIVSETDPSQNEYELQMDAFGNLITSDEAWLDFLRDHYVFDPNISANKLEFAFSTSLNRTQKDNALHIPNALGMLLSWTGDNRSQQNGVTINIRGRGISLSATDRVRISLRQEGASAIRYNTWDTDNSANRISIRIWNLDPVTANVIAAINGTAPDVLPGDAYRPSTPQFHERSPANDRWVFTIREDMGGGVNRNLLAQLDQISDIVITFDVTYFTP